MDFRFVTPRKNPDSEMDIFRASNSIADFSFVFAKEIGYATFAKPVFALLVNRGGDDQKIYVFSLSDFDAAGLDQPYFKAGWYWFDITSVVLEPVDFYTEFPDGIVFPQNIERPNPTFCEAILFETGTAACKLAVLEETKLLMRLSIASKGVSVPESTPFRQYAGKVGEIQSGSNTEFITFDIESFNGTSEWYDDSGNMYTSASYQIQGPYVFNHGTYQTIQDIRNVASGVFFSLDGGGNAYLRVPNIISEGGSVYFIFENGYPSLLRLRMYATFK